MKSSEDKVSHSDSIAVVQDDVDTNVRTASSKKERALPAEFYSSYLSDAAKERKPSPIRGLFPLEATPGVISLLAGKPNAITFPITGMSLDVASPSDPSQSRTIKVEESDLKAGLQYGPTAGFPPLLDWITKLQEISHGRKSGDTWRVSMGNGSQDLIYKAVQAMVNRGDAVLLEKPMYAGVIPMFQALHCEMIEVDTDAEGISSHSLRNIFENWPAGKTKPKVLYTVPYGCNPTGMTATIARRKEVIALSREHGFIILEDDPYFYLYYGPEPRPPSYFSLEAEQPEVGRVLRFDSLSKILSSGMRIGFVSGPAALIGAMDMHTATANLQCVGLTQSITYTLLHAWGHDSFLVHTRNVSAFYREKCAVFEWAMNEYLTGLCEWTPPQAGMFFWFKLLVPGGDSESIIRKKAFEQGVLALPGTVFLPNGDKTAYVRASFSLLDEKDAVEAIKRLRRVLLDVRGEHGEV
ncbi:PLP-dependent transferase [Punctularia strigosozonata HHB-11173 SS5]|uniref:PLP-dependent transferase n=1 Tax=Punctularia strigosozonata (strain HHB-11173) TaxID=741275 RepID=UPI0004417FB6|nr:PLP-dependent transferase [Punctularia strigosozonata HHB-11173 SS5]EIN10079.1 PLP-dependent transferase [Punctularia strigosozonata HHB-11173 SS5]